MSANRNRWRTRGRWWQGDSQGGRQASPCASGHVRRAGRAFSAALLVTNLQTCPPPYTAAPILLKAPHFSRRKGEEGVKHRRAEVVQQLPAVGWQLATRHRDLARKRLTEIAVDLDAVDTVPAKFEELVYRDGTPFIESKARDIAKSDARFRIVLGNVPSSGSGDIEELRDKARVFFASLGVQRVASGKLRELYEKLVFGHRSES